NSRSAPSSRRRRSALRKGPAEAVRRRAFLFHRSARPCILPGGGWKPSTPRKGRPMHGKTANRGQALHCQVSSQLSPSSPPQRDSLVLPSNALLRKIRRQQGVLIVVGVLP